jgi:hypothetical protein
MSIELLELAAAALGDLLDEVVFVGGATVGSGSPIQQHRPRGPPRTST